MAADQFFTKGQGGDQLNSIQPGAFVDGIDDRQP
jgi:hypothetical protein